MSWHAWCNTSCISQGFLQGDFMKKQVAIVVSFSALLTLSAFAPKELWQKNTIANRFPASIEDSKEDSKVESKDESKNAQCLKDQQPTALEDEIKKLMADKESILKEIEDLKAKKEESPSHNKQDKKIAQTSETEDAISIMSQLTSMMISQQEQQMIVMQQMFSMMNQMQMMQIQSYPQQYNQSQNFMSAFQAPQAYYQQPSIFGVLGQEIGISYSDQSAPSYQNPYEIQTRTPSAQMDQHFPHSEINVQPQLQSEYPVGNMGYNFFSSDASSEMQRMLF